MAKPYVMTPARAAALRKAQLASARARKGRRLAGRRHYSSNPAARGQGVAGLRRNVTPYARINKSSSTIGVNTGTVIPFTKKRIAFGGYFRVENTNKRTAVDRFISKGANAIAPRGSTLGNVRQWAGKNVHIDNPAIRANIGGAQVRLGTSRRAGPTLIIRKGKHQARFTKSKSGIKRYNKRMRTITPKKKSRRQRRRK